MVGVPLPEQGSSLTSRRDQPCWKTLVSYSCDKSSPTPPGEANLVYRGVYIKALFGSAGGSGPSFSSCPLFSLLVSHCRVVGPDKFGTQGDEIQPTEMHQTNQGSVG